MRILVTRPREDGEEIAALLVRMGHEALLAPLLSTHFHDGAEPDFDGVQAILATSANGVRALVRRTARRDIALFAVGPQTEQEARNAGFTDVRSANGDARALAAATVQWTSPDKGALLHVCGEEAPGTLQADLAQAGFTVRRCALYRVDAATSLPSSVSDALSQGAVDAALFFSPRSARIFRELVNAQAGAGMIALCISPITAQALAPMAFAQVRVAAQPNQSAILALIA